MTSTTINPMAAVHKDGTCPGCNGERGDHTGIGQVYYCEGCGGIFGECYLGESYTLVKPGLRPTSGAAQRRQKYYDLTCLGSGSITRRHGWYDPKTRRITQTG